MTAVAPPPAPAWLAFGQLALARLVGLRSDDLDAAGDADEEARRGAAVESAAVELRASLGRPGAFADLVANARLDPDEADVLAVALAVEVDAAAQTMLARLQREPGPSHLALGTVAELFGAAHRGVHSLGPDAALRRCAFVTVTNDGPWREHRAVVHPTVVWSVLGDDGVDPTLPPRIDAVHSDDAGGHPLTVVTGTDRMVRRRAAAASTLGRSFVVSGVPADEVHWSALVREATITGSGVVLEVADALPADAARWIERADHLAWSLSSAVDLPLDVLPRRPWLGVEAPMVEPTDAEWAAAFGDAPRRHRLTPEQLALVGPAFEAYGGDLDAAVRRLVGGRMEQLATRVRPRRTWDDLVLSSGRKAALRSIVDRYVHSSEVYDEWGFVPVPSRGVVALFSGPSGTGKTMAAEVLAGVLGLDVFKLDLSSVVSKYIGETEQNLERVFEAASAGNLLLFFDEADSLFGKRSEVRDARDRYANIEVSYLLQRVEDYDGLIVLATNFERNIDEAFMRRIHARIQFELPEPAERREIWERNLPPTAPRGDIDIAWLADHFELSGGSIRNATVHAAFDAAAAGAPITTASAARGVAVELRKMGRLVHAADFGEFAGAVRDEADD